MGFKSAEFKVIDGEKWFKFNKRREHFRYWYSNFLTTVFIILLIVIMCYAYTHVHAIVTTPYLYGASAMKDKTGEEVTCTCIQGDPNAYPLKRFYFNSTSIWVDKPIDSGHYVIPEINTSELDSLKP